MFLYICERENLVHSILFSSVYITKARADINGVLHGKRLEIVEILFDKFRGEIIKAVTFNSTTFITEITLFEANTSIVGKSIRSVLSSFHLAFEARIR